MTVAARLRKLEAQATPGPWRLRKDLEIIPEVVAYQQGHWRDARRLIGQMLDQSIQSHDDAAFIASARNLLPLLADLAEADEQVISAADGLAVPAALRGNFVAFLASLDNLDAALARVAAKLDEAEQ